MAAAAQAWVLPASAPDLGRGVAPLSHAMCGVTAADAILISRPSKQLISLNVGEPYGINSVSV